MNDLLQFQIAFTLWVQSISPALDSVFNAINFLQTEEFFLIALPIIWWCINKRIGASLVILFLSSDFLARFLKGVTNVTRPYDLSPRVRMLDKQPDSSFPSAGTLDTAIFWSYLALQFRQRAVWVWAIIAIVLIGFTRVYLGAHYPTDVIASIVIAAIILALVVRGKIAERIAASPHIAQWAMAIIWPLALALIWLNAETATALGALLGFNIGLMIEMQSVRFDPRGEWWKQIVKIVIGLAVAVALRFALKPLLPTGDVFTMVRYAVIGLWMGVGAPWLFVMAKLAQRTKSD